MFKNLVCAVLCCAGLIFTGCSSSPAVAKNPVTPVQTKLVLDVRTPDEYASGHLPGAINLPVDQVEARAAQVVPDKMTPVFVHCQGGHRSARAKATLQKLGYTNVTDLGSYENAQRVLQSK